MSEKDNYDAKRIDSYQHIDDSMCFFASLKKNLHLSLKKTLFTTCHPTVRAFVGFYITIIIRPTGWCVEGYLLSE